MQITFNALGNATEIIRGLDLFSGSGAAAWNKILVTFDEEIENLTGLQIMITRADNQTNGWIPLMFKELDENDIPIYQYTLSSYDLSVAGTLLIQVKWVVGEDEISAEAITQAFVNLGTLNFIPEPTDITQATVDAVNAEIQDIWTLILEKTGSGIYLTNGTINAEGGIMHIGLVVLPEHRVLQKGDLLLDTSSNSSLAEVISVSGVTVTYRYLGALKGATGATGATGAQGETGLHGYGFFVTTSELLETSGTIAKHTITQSPFRGLQERDLIISSNENSRGAVGLITSIEDNTVYYSFVNNFRGDTGLTGATGATGATGPQGEPGEDGGIMLIDPAKTYLVYQGGVTSKLLVAKDPTGAREITINWIGGEKTETIPIGTGQYTITLPELENKVYLFEITGIFNGFYVNANADEKNKYYEVYIGSNCAIGDNAFYGCSKLKRAEVSQEWIPNYIGNNAFRDCKSLTKFYGETVQSIGNYAFSNTGLTDIFFPIVITIGNYAFTASKINRFHSPSTLTSIGEYAFWQCNYLKIIEMETVPTMKSNSFNGCTIGIVYGSALADTAIVSAGASLLSPKIPYSYIDADGTLTANSDAKIPTQKAVKTFVINTTNSLFKSVTYTANTGVLTFTKTDDSTVQIDLPLELIVTDGYYDAGATEIVLELANGGTINIPVGALANTYYADETTLELYIDAADSNKLKFRIKNGADISNAIATFTAASERVNINSGENHMTIFGKIKKWFTDLKAHAFANPSTTLNSGTTSIPSDKLLSDELALVPQPNLLINSRFLINTAGQSSYTEIHQQTCDAWIKGNSNTFTTIEPTEYSYKITALASSSNTIPARQFLDFNFTQLRGKLLTLSGLATVAGTGTYAFTIRQYSDTNWSSQISSNNATITSGAVSSVTVTIDEACQTVAILLRAPSQVSGDVLTVRWIKLEINNYATAYVPLPTGQELAQVQRYVDKTSISTVMPISSAAASNEKVLGEKVVYNEFAKKAPLANPTFTGSVTVPTPVNGTDASTKAYVDIKSFSATTNVYDIVIKTQADFETMIASPTWLDAESVALVGQFILSAPNGIKVPDTVKQIHGFNSAKITVTNFVYNAPTAQGGLWYDELPTTDDYSICDLEVDCTGSLSYGFVHCKNLTNCTGTGTGTGPTVGFGFLGCTNLTNCTGTGIGYAGYGFSGCTNLTNCTGTGTGYSGYGFSGCTNLTNCTGTGTGTGTTVSYGFLQCTNLTNCTGTGIGAVEGYGFYYITTASNCRDGGSVTDMWGGTNKNIDLDTCCKTRVVADNTTLNT